MVTGITFRPATSADLPAIVALLADDHLGQNREDPSLPLDQRYLEAFAAVQADKNQMLAVAEQDGEIIGSLQLSFIPNLSRRGAWRGQIENVRIAANQRGQGTGRVMIAWAIQQCRMRDCGLVQLTSDKSRSDAIRFYESLGFEASHEGMKLVLD
jgi:ribosomal protein S18 acetylase RimI-like enzyme